MVILPVEQAPFDWVATLVANEGNLFLTYEMIEVLYRELPNFSSKLDVAYAAKDREALIYHLDLIQESSIYCPMPKLTRHVDSILEHLDKDEFWPTQASIETCRQFISEVKYESEVILDNRAKIRRTA
jgi:hypothetical protein